MRKAKPGIKKKSVSTNKDAYKVLEAVGKVITKLAKEGMPVGYIEYVLHKSTGHRIVEECGVKRLKELHKGIIEDSKEMEATAKAKAP